MISFAVVADLCVAFVVSVLKAVVVWFVGKWIIGRLLDVLKKMQFLEKLDASAANYLMNAAKGVMYIVLALAVINVLGIETSSVLAILASVGVAVGLALQGALSNLVGGIMLLVYRPFNVGDYISASGAEGTVKDITLFYTQIHTVDNVRISVPNGALMDTNVTNFSAEKTRRVDLTFNLAKDENVDTVVQILKDAMTADGRVLHDPAPFAALLSETNEAQTFVLRAWVDSADYWDTRFALTAAVNKAFKEAGMKTPAARIITDK